MNILRSQIKVIGIILARKESKRLKDKNVLPFCGHPLFDWSIEQAKECKFIDEIIISTDDERIIDYCNLFYGKFNNIQVRKRPDYLATYKVSSIDVIIYELEEYKKSINNIIVILLQPTSPLREVKDIEEAFYKFMLNKGCIISIFKEDDLHYKLNGAIYIDYLDNLINNKSFIPKQFYIMPPERSIDIDDANDFFLAEVEMEKRLNT